MNLLDYYLSLDSSKRDQEEYILKTLTSHNIVPTSIRFDEENTVVKTINNRFYFFKGLDTENIAEVTESDFISKSYPFGCDLVKAPTQGGQKPGMSGVPSLEEEDDVQAQQTDLITDKHPGGAMGTTPDLPERGRIWHEEQLVRSEDLEKLNDLSKSLNTLITPQYSDKEKEFMLTLGKTPEEIDSGHAKMNPTQKVLFQRWLGKSLRNRMYSLRKSL